jgi:RimJ/RimL family protein N-acetyltransferase
MMWPQSPEKIAAAINSHSRKAIRGGRLMQTNAIVIRKITASDAEAYNAHRRRMANEPENNIPYSCGEYTRTVAEDRQKLLATISDPNQKIYIAGLDDRIIGLCVCRGGSLSAVQHVVGLGIDIAPEYRNQGVGRALLTRMTNWARQHRVIRRIELTVFAHNERAINLYLKHGFVIEGLSKEAYFKSGRYIDAYSMALIFKK